MIVVIALIPSAHLHVPGAHAGRASYVRVGKRNRVDRHSWGIERLLLGRRASSKLDAFEVLRDTKLTRAGLFADACWRVPACVLTCADRR